MRNIRKNPTVADIAFWEVEYHDGTSVNEDNTPYSQIQRGNIKKFKFILGGENVFELTMPDGLTGNNLLYRRRTSMSPSTGERRVLFIIGFIPNGPAYAIDLEEKSYRMLEGGFDPADPDLYPPVPMPGEPHF